MPPQNPRQTDKPPRKRNVISRARTGCLTCRRRRLKCDENKPGCDNCRRINATCEGYAQKITFKDQTNLTVERARGKPTGSSVTAAGKKKSQPGDASSAATLDDEASASPDTVKNESVGAQSQGQTTPPTSYLEVVAPVHVASNAGTGDGYIPCSPVSLDICSSPKRVLPNSTLGLAGAFEFPEDYTYFQYSAGGGFSSIARVLPLSELFQSEPVSSHVYNAALALAALSLSNKSESYNTRTIRRHAFHHSLKAVQGLQKELAQTRQLTTTSRSATPAVRDDTALSLFATILLAANFELQRANKTNWVKHMRGAASCLNAVYKSLLRKSTGMLLIRAFARMALLLRLYNEDYDVTTPDYMNQQLATWLNARLLAESPRLHDRMLLFIEEITALEIQKRAHPEQEPLWATKSADLLYRLEQWRADLPPEDIPIDDQSSGAHLTISYPDDNSTPTPSNLLCIPALHFPRSSDPCIAAVNYASYLCTRMRARTRYPPSPSTNNNNIKTGDNRILPQDTPTTALTICRLAASLPTTHFGDSFAYSYGMLPSVVGAYRWSSNTGLKSWVRNWLHGFRTAQEGIWNVGQTLTLMGMMDELVHNQGGDGGGFVAARMVDDDFGVEEEIERDLNGDGDSDGDGSGNAGGWKGERDVVGRQRPLRITLSMRGSGGGRSARVVTVR